jgi:hypothetical protein
MSFRQFDTGAVYRPLIAEQDEIREMMDCPLGLQVVREPSQTAPIMPCRPLAPKPGVAGTEVNTINRVTRCLESIGQPRKEGTDDPLQEEKSALQASMWNDGKKASRPKLGMTVRILATA